MPPAREVRLTAQRHALHVANMAVGATGTQAEPCSPEDIQALLDDVSLAPLVAHRNAVHAAGIHAAAARKRTERKALPRCADCALPCCEGRV